MLPGGVLMKLFGQEVTKREKDIWWNGVIWGMVIIGAAILVSSLFLGVS